MTNQFSFEQRPGLCPQKIELILKNRFERRMAGLDPNKKDMTAIKAAVEITTQYAKAMTLINSPLIDRRPKNRPTQQNPGQINLL